MNIKFIIKGASRIIGSILLSVCGLLVLVADWRIFLALTIFLAGIILVEFGRSE